MVEAIIQGSVLLDASRRCATTVEIIFSVNIARMFAEGKRCGPGYRHELPVDLFIVPWP